MLMPPKTPMIRQEKMKFLKLFKNLLIFFTISMSLLYLIYFLFDRTKAIPSQAFHLFKGALCYNFSVCSILKNQAVIRAERIRKQ